MTDQARIYGVSYGNGNDGVSQLYPDFYVRTAQPYALALGAMVDQFKPEFMQQAAEACSVDGEADYTISAMILDPLDEDGAEDGEAWSDHNGAWKLCEVFPVDEDDVRDGAPFYESAEDALTAEAWALAQKEA